MRYDVAIVGAGIVGLASALRLLEQMPQLRLSVIDKENAIAHHQTGRNSGVIHSGIYYKPGSLKARNCSEGYHQLIDFCRKEYIPHELCGKIIVATRQNEIPQLYTIYQRGLANGLKGLKTLNTQQIREIEPHCSGIEGIWVPQAGIIDYTKVALAYRRRIEEAGGHFFMGERVAKVLKKPQHVEVVTQNRTISARLMINCTGLYSDKLAEMTQEEGLGMKIIPFRGEYYKLIPEKEYLVNNLIYPVPNPAFPFLGVHFTRMMRGGVEAGPNAVLAFKREGYKKSDFDFKELMDVLRYPGFRKLSGKYWVEGMGELYRSFSKRAFVKALQHLVPDVTVADVVPSGAGVRATACMKDGQLADDYLIFDKPGVINVCNAPSPAATSSLAIGKMIADRAIKRLI